MIGNFMIFGDSYSTHKDHIPDGYAFYYCDGGRDESQPVTKMTAKETWWGRLTARTDATLVYNDSWSGSTVGYTGYQGDCSTSSSFIYRYRQLSKRGFFEADPIDTVFVFGGTNDSWSNAPLGEEQYGEWTEEDLYRVRPALCYFVGTLKKELPHARIVVIANCDIKTEVIECIEHAASFFGAECVTLDGVDKLCGHPTVRGMEEICSQILEQIGE